MWLSVCVDSLARLAARGCPRPNRESIRWLFGDSLIFAALSEGLGVSCSNMVVP
jgi:hypothetical protein